MAVVGSSDKDKFSTSALKSPLEKEQAAIKTEFHYIKLAKMEDVKTGPPDIICMLLVCLRDGRGKSLPPFNVLSWC